MKRTTIIAALVALATPANALDYNCSPLTGGCTPRATPQPWFDSPAIVYPPSPRPSTCPLDGSRCVVVRHTRAGAAG
jgi:hypothetical protein